MNKVNTHLTKPPLYPITAVPDSLPFQTIALDFITKLLESLGHNTILTITDHDCSKASIFIPCKEAIDSEGVAKLYIQHVVPHYGLPKKIISDRDTRFTSNFTKELCCILGIKQNISTAYHPQTDGQSERTNQSLEQYLRIVCRQDQHAWAEWLPLAQYVRNSWPSSTTKKTPYELILRYTPNIHQPNRVTSVPGITKRLEQIKEHRLAVQHTLKQAQQRLIKETKYKPFNEGDKVWLEGTHLRLPYDTMKLAPRRYGPFEVAAKISDIAYRLKLPDMWKIHNVFHASLLTPYKEMDKHRPNFLEPPPDLIDGEEEWEIEKILRHRMYWKKKQYLIQWKGYTPAHDSWIDESGLHTPELLANYKKQLVRQILINLIQTTAEIPHDQSSAAEVPHDQSSTAETPHDQSSTAETPHDQSALYKCWESSHIRTLQMSEEETFPTSPQTGSSLPETQNQEASPPSLCPKAILPCKPTPTPALDFTQVSQVPTQKTDTHNTRPQSPAQHLLP